MKKVNKVVNYIKENINILLLIPTILVAFGNY